MKRIRVLMAMISLSLMVGTLAHASSDDLAAAGDAFTFVRVQYDSMGGEWSGDWLRTGGTWSIDYPDADINFLRGVTRLTNIHINSNPTVLRLDDDRIFEYPFLYMLEMGRAGGPQFNEKEIHNLRESLTSDSV